MEEKTIKIKVLDGRGEALEYIKNLEEGYHMLLNEITSNKKWLYVDGEKIFEHSLNKEKLEKAQDILLMNELLGGRQV